VALALTAMLEGLWLRLMMSDDVTREAALRAANEFLAAAFPQHFELVSGAIRVRS